MRRHQSPIAVDFGERQVSVLQLQRHGARLRVSAAHAQPVLPTTSAQERDERLIVAGKRALRSAAFRGRTAVVALSLGEIETRHVRIASENLDDADARIATHLQGPASGLTTGSGALAICPLPVADMFEQGERRREFLCCVASEAAIARRIALTEGVGLVPEAIDLDPVTQVRALLRPSPTDSFAHLDFGPADTRVTIVRSGQPVWMRSVPVGAEHLCTAIEARLQLGVGRILELAAASLDESNLLSDIVTDTIAESIEVVLDRISEGIRYCGSLFQGRTVTSIRVAGPVAHLPGLVPYVAHRLGISAEIVDPFAGVEPGPLASCPASVRTSFATAVGLALGRLPT